MTRTPRHPCAMGCGRNVVEVDGCCRACANGKPPPEANPKLHRTEYLIRCVEELRRRKAEMTEVLAKLNQDAA